MHPNRPPRPAFVHQSTVHFKQPIHGIPPFVPGSVVPHVVRGNVPSAFVHHHAIPIVRHQVVVVRPHAPDPRDLAYQNFAKHHLNPHNGHSSGGYRPH